VEWFIFFTVPAGALDDESSQPPAAYQWVAPQICYSTLPHAGQTWVSALCGVVSLFIVPAGALDYVLGNGAQHLSEQTSDYPSPDKLDTWDD